MSLSMDRTRFSPGRPSTSPEKGLAPETVGQEHHKSNTSPSQKTAMPRWRGKGREKSTIELACTWIVDHQISIAVLLLSILFFSHGAFPRVRHHSQKFFSISYYNHATGTYALGWNDIFFVLYWIVVFTGMRCAVMDYVLTPIAARAGIKSKKTRVRFAEQAWILLYEGTFWSCGTYIIYNSPYFLSLRALWRNWPIREMSGLSKWYYLVQFAFWLQQIVIVHIEERRKDHVQMFTHHVLTCALIFTSYGYHLTRVGNLVLCLMDGVDLFLPLAKILKYLKFRLPCDIAFGVFMLAWFIARHVLYMWVCWSLYSHVPDEIAYGCYRGSVQTLEGPFAVPNDFDHLTQPFRDPVGLVCWNDGIKWVFLSMLLALQVLLLIWFTMIIKVAYKVISGQGADDTRSDDEAEDDEGEKEFDGKDATLEKGRANIQSEALIEKEAFSTNMDLYSDSPPGPRPLQPSSRKEVGEPHTSSALLSDHQELLGGIGCR